MTAYVGKQGVVEVGANAVAEVVSFNVNLASGVTPAPALGEDWTNNISGTKSWSGTITCNFDHSDTDGQEALTIGASVTLSLYPVDDATGNTKVSGTAVITGLDLNNGGNEVVVSRTFTFTGDGEAVTSTVA